MATTRPNASRSDVSASTIPRIVSCAGDNASNNAKVLALVNDASRPENWTPEGLSARGVADPEALLASGGFCAPAMPDYGIPQIAGMQRPLKDGLGGLGMDRSRASDCRPAPTSRRRHFLDGAGRGQRRVDLVERDRHDPRRYYIAHYNSHRPHRGLRQRAPNDEPVLEIEPGRPIRRHPTCGGLINEYRHAA